MWQSYKPLVTIYIILPPFVNSSLLENSYFAVLYPFTSYVKLQQAYVAEANEYGSWKLIGYTAPNSGETNNFEYTATALAEDGASSKDAETNVWEAANKAKLNDCEAGKNWTISTNTIGSNGQDTYKAEVNGTGCQALTATFGKIGQ